MPTWMVVEDEPDIYDVLLAMFEIWGIEGVAFVDGAEAVSWIDGVDQSRIRGELPELAILDIRLPEISGPEVGARLRKSPILGDVAIVLITAYHMTPDEEREVLAQSQADMLLYKPLPAMPQLREAMDGVIAKHKAARPDDPAVASSEAASADRTAQAERNGKPASKPAPAKLPAPPPKPAPQNVQTPRPARQPDSSESTGKKTDQ